MALHAIKKILKYVTKQPHRNILGYIEFRKL